MQVVVTSLLRDKLPPLDRVFHSVFYRLCTFISLIEIVYYCISVFMVASLIYFCYITGYTRYSVHFIIISPLTFRAENNPDQWYQSRLLLIIFLVHVPDEVRV